jgi:hypothetical protein
LWRKRLYGGLAIADIAANKNSAEPFMTQRCLSVSRWLDSFLVFSSIW